MTPPAPAADTNLSSLFTRAQPLYSTQPLLRHAGRSVTHAELNAAVDRLTGRLRAGGLRPGERFLLLAANRPQWLAALLAALRVGAIVVPVNPALTATEVGYMVEHAAPKAGVVDAALERLLPPGADFPRIRLPVDWESALAGAPDTAVHPCLERDPAIMFYTSGTTGRPKGALLGHGAERLTADLVASHFRIGPQDVSLIASPLSFIYPLVIDCLACMRAGATVVLQERFHPERALRAIEEERATLFMGVPTMFTMMLEWADGRDVDLSSLRFCISAGQNLPWHVARRFRERFGVVVYDLWGQTEGTPITSYDPAIEAEGRPESCGRALPGCAVRVLDDAGRELPAGEVGEVLLSGPGVMLEYYRNAAATAETLRAGWIHTGDLGKLDA
ncbi:MAG TPA: long-chain fatty acid--CoA ligase, partial [Burkholderiales bacterium]|nr:long-chain fatty acid--CoA ligase [Burkholderiales bacterium]